MFAQVLDSLGTLGQVVLSHIWLLLLGVTVFVYFYSTRNFNYWKDRNIDGPKPLPFVGTFFSLSKPIPYLYMEQLKKFGNFFGGYRFNKPVLYISDPVVIKRIMVSDFHHFRNRLNRASSDKLSKLNLVSARDEQWKRIRSILTPMFTSAKLRKMEGKMRQCTRNMVDTFERCVRQSKDGMATVVAHDVMGSFTMDVIASCAFATDTNAHVEPNNAFVRNAHDIMSFKVSRFLVGSLTPSVIISLLRKLKFPVFANQAATFFTDLCYHLVRERRSEKAAGGHHDDMLQLMVEAEHTQDTDDNSKQSDQLESHHVNDGAEELAQQKQLLKTIVGNKRLSEDEIVAQAIVFFLAGYETTASTLSFCMHELAVNPDVQDKLVNELREAKKTDAELRYQTVQGLPYLDAVLSETLRKYPPAIQLGRECNADQYHIPEAGYTLHRGDVVTFPVYALHHSEQYWPKPEHFDPDRFMPENRENITPYTYLPFGGGPRNCIGMRFALTEAKLGLAQLLDRFEFVRTPTTPDQLKIGLCFPLLKTEPIRVGIKSRTS